MDSKSEITFSIRGIEYEVFFAVDGAIEIYETNNPAKTGFIFDDKKAFLQFINSITDIAENILKQEEFLDEG